MTEDNRTAGATAGNRRGTWSATWVDADGPQVRTGLSGAAARRLRTERRRIGIKVSISQEAPEPGGTQLALGDDLAPEDMPPARRTDPRTSWASARSVDSERRNSQVDSAVVAVAQAGERGRTNAELHGLLGGDRANLSRRVTDARKRGWVRDSGTERRGPSGRWGIVWQITASGMTRAAQVTSRQAAS